MEKIGNYYHISKENVDIVPEKGTMVASCYINCFDRELVLLLNDRELNIDDIEKIEEQLQSAYYDWHDDSESYMECCEEYMISKLDTYYRNSIVAVIYIGDDSDDEDN